MILGSSFEFEKSSNPEIIERPTDNVEMPQVTLFKIIFWVLNTNFYLLVNETITGFARKNSWVSIFVYLQH